jgi:hypothetical protein
MNDRKQQGNGMHGLARGVCLALLCTPFTSVAAERVTNTWKVEPDFDLSATANLVRHGTTSARFGTVLATAKIGFTSDARRLKFGAFANYQGADNPAFDGFRGVGAYVGYDGEYWRVSSWLMSITPGSDNALLIFGTGMKRDLTARTEFRAELFVPVEYADLARLAVGASWSPTENLSLGILGGTDADGDFSYEAKLEVSWDIL